MSDDLQSKWGMTIEEARQVIFDETNARRREAGVFPLVRQDQLDVTAQAYAERMVKEDFFSHVAPDGTNFVTRVRASGYPGIAWGENISKGYSSARQVVDAWMRSPGHRANLLRADANQIGIGAYSESGRSVRCVQAFGRLTPEHLPQPPLSTPPIVLTPPPLPAPSPVMTPVPPPLPPQPPIPVISDVTTIHGVPVHEVIHGVELIVVGSNFGTAWGQITLASRLGLVKTWQDRAITFLAPFLTMEPSIEAPVLVRTATGHFATGPVIRIMRPEETPTPPPSPATADLIYNETERDLLNALVEKVQRLEIKVSEIEVKMRRPPRTP